ncbi:MAG: CotH kinase family protein [Lachnospiraceae bacterium]|nr:CotH kinase family protein [Lachnospiraceae bacterium]
MRKRTCMGILLAAAAVAAVFCLYFKNRNSVLLHVENGQPCISVRTAQSENRVFLWQDEKEAGEETAGFFFLPSCVSHHKIRLGDLGGSSVWIDGQLYEEGDSFSWEEDYTYGLQITDASYEDHTYEIGFMKSENIPAMFIDTASGGLDYLHEDKENEEAGRICILQADGVTEYQDELPRISGRGNSTWEFEKKPYALKLKADQPLCGLRASDRWRLLALWNEGSRMGDKIAMDLAQELGLSYSTQGTWVDLYLNGEYRGIYLLTESVTVGSGRVDIYDMENINKQKNVSIVAGTASRYEEEDNKGYLLEDGAETDGGYLIEKDHPKHWEAEENGFRLSRGDLFTINSPRHASKEQVAYIQNYVEEIDALVQDADPAVWEKLDLTSFVKRFLVDEIALEMDTGSTSMYFYKDRGDEKLYSGPAWDYDNAFGEDSGSDGFFVNYGETIVNNNERLAISLNWYQKLYETPEMYQCTVEEYAGILPFFERLLGTGIDRYANQIRASAAMDDARWESVRAAGNDMPRYKSFEANVNYTKFFLANRLNCLCARWGVPHEAFTAPESGEMHQVTFSVYEGVVETVEAPDGEPLSYTPDYDGGVYQGWTYRRGGEPYSSYIPVYEDMELYNAKWE